MELTDFKFIKKLTSGSFGFCDKKESEYHDYFYNEVKILHKLEHPNIVAYYYYWETGNDNYILMEYLSGGSLHDLQCGDTAGDIQIPMKEDDALNFFSQLVLGLDHMHSRNIMHRDLKPENILFDYAFKKIKIIDFGLSRDVSEELDVPVVNPNFYTAPENWNEENPHTFKSDVWSIGALLYYFTANKTPEHLENKLEVLSDLPPVVSIVSKKILKVEVSERPNCGDIVLYSELREVMCKYYESLESLERDIVGRQLQKVIDCKNK